MLLDLLPEARFLFIHRHPGAIVRSGMRRGWSVDHPADYARITPAGNEVPPALWERWEAFEKLCWLWNACNSFALDVAGQAEAGRILQFDARQLYSGAIVPQLFDFIGVPQPAQQAVADVLSKKHNAQRHAAFPTYDVWTPAMKETLVSHAGETMARLGYAEVHAGVDAPGQRSESAP